MKVTLLAALVGLGLQTLTASAAWAGTFVQTNLVSDIPGLALIVDSELKNPWGVSHSATSPFWVSDQGTNVSTLYMVTTAGVSKVGLTVAIPTIGVLPEGPTGQVFNESSPKLVAFR